MVSWRGEKWRRGGFRTLSAKGARERGRSGWRSVTAGHLSLPGYIRKRKSKFLIGIV